MVYILAVLYLFIGIFLFSGWISREDNVPPGIKVFVSLAWPIYLVIRVILFAIFFISLLSRK